MLTKIPLGGGLTGGSSNATTILIALNYHWQINIDANILTEIANQLSANVPLFVKDYAAFAQGIGDKLLPIYPVDKWYLVAYLNGISIPTKANFADQVLK